ncbi:MAG: hypothetical protein ACP5LS_03820, partial [Thermoprotei archaeon]
LSPFLHTLRLLKSPCSSNDAMCLLNVTHSDRQAILNLEGPPVNWAYVLETLAIYLLVAAVIVALVTFIVIYVKKKGVGSLKRSLEGARRSPAGQ